MTPAVQRFSDALDELLQQQGFALPSQDVVGLLLGTAFVVAMKAGKSPDDVVAAAAGGALALKLDRTRPSGQG